VPYRITLEVKKAWRESDLKKILGYPHVGGVITAPTTIRCPAVLKGNEMVVSSTGSGRLLETQRLSGRNVFGLRNAPLHTLGTCSSATQSK
jgi:hypothetical protein